MKLPLCKPLPKKYNFIYRHILYTWLLLFCTLPAIQSQSPENWEEIFLVDTISYTSFYSGDIPDGRYSPGHLFDANFNTCWVSKLDPNHPFPSLFFELPDNEPEQPNLYIFSGYGKTRDLFFKNDRPKKIRISLYSAIIPDGFYSETGFMSEAIKLPYQQIFTLKDTFDIQNLTLQLSATEIMEHRKQTLIKYSGEFDPAPYDTLTLIELEILEVYPGTVYDDVCISEIFFDNCYISYHGINGNNYIRGVYVTSNDDTVIIDNDKGEELVLFQDRESIFQVAEITDDKNWAIIISMDRQISERAETSYLIFDLRAMEEISDRIEKINNEYVPGMPVFLEQVAGNTYLVFSGTDNKDKKIELR